MGMSPKLLSAVFACDLKILRLRALQYSVNLPKLNDSLNFTFSAYYR